MALDLQKIRSDFPILAREVYKKPLVYFDNGATTQKPAIVIDTQRSLEAEYNSSIHRGIHYLSGKMTTRYEEAREEVRGFLNAGSAREIVFTSGTTASINTLAFSFGEKFISEGDEILISEMEHHSNIVPWQMMCERKGARLKVLPFNDRGELLLDKLDELLNEHTRLVAINHASNSLGTINPVKEIIDRAHAKEIPVMLDGAQMVQHGPVDVIALDCEFYVFSGHKIFGPTGIGVLYGKEEWLEQLPPYQGGGDMVDQVSFDKTTYNELPFKFEAGTSNYIAAIGLAEALRYVKGLGLENIANHEQELCELMMEKLSAFEGLKIFGQAGKRIAVFSFLPENVHAYDAGMILDKMGIAVRTGTHCTQPVMDHFGIEGTVRASLVFYNTREEVEIFAEGLNKTIEMLR
ncbi:MAG: cysteine desulfurase CsdA [Bacteroidetes bacterium]|nr:MAG: cysteine desulfurase CsdA [Bacteroidota bacterium]